jgi:hypothetical protein
MFAGENCPQLKKIKNESKDVISVVIFLSLAITLRSYPQIGANYERYLRIVIF